MINYPFSTPSPYIHAAMSQAVHAMMSGGPLPPNCYVMAMPFQQMLPQLMMNPAIGGDPMIYSKNPPYYGPSPYTTTPQPRAVVPQQNYNYAIVPYKNSKKKSPHQPHSNVYDSSSFDSYMRDLSWSRLFDHSHRKTSKQQTPDQISQSSQSNSSSSSTTSDETIRRVNVSNKYSSNQQTKSSLPFKYSSEFIPGLGKQQSQKIKSNDVFIIKKP